jgi:putative restriction endonuclease
VLLGGARHALAVRRPDGRAVLARRTRCGENRRVRGFIAPTDHDWYRFFLGREEHDEVNFWRPGRGMFRALRPGEPFFFKLKAPHNAIGGFGIFARFAELPVWMAWDVFRQANGTPDEHRLVRRLGRLSGSAGPLGLDALIGCIAVAQPVFFAPDEWVAPPADWQRQVVRGAGYDLTAGEGRRVWEDCVERAAARRASADWTHEAVAHQLLGAPQLIRPRLGQGSFRLAVLDAYGNQCAVTTEHSLPVLEAAHIRPWSAGGRHEVRNGLPLRRDLHRLFDLGYVTVRPDHRFAVSPRLADEWHNGRSYYALDGREIALPADRAERPERELLEWHGDVVFRAE